MNTLPSKSILCLAVAAALAAGPALAAPGGVPGKPGGGEETGNNLSTPVVWSDGVTKALREYNDDPTASLFEGLTSACTDFPGETCYQQKDPLNIWQAESWDATGSTTSYGNPVGAISGFMVDEVDWGDNLEARDWNVNSIVRLETVLWQNLGGVGNHALPTMTSYEMSYLFGQGPSEMWGTTTLAYAGNEATVYSDCARLTIQKIAELGEETPALEWDPLNTKWGDAPTFYNSAVWQATAGSDFFSAEINIPGRVIYGYGWNVRKLGDADGIYRLTFSLDGSFEDGQQCGATTLNTWLDAAVIREPTEEALALFAEEGETGGGTAVVDAANNLSYIDVRILPRSGGGGTGGGGGGQGGGNGQGGGGPKGR